MTSVCVSIITKNPLIYESRKRSFSSLLLFKVLGVLPHVVYHSVIVKHILHVKRITGYFLHEIAFNGTIRLKNGISAFPFGVKLFKKYF